MHKLELQDVRDKKMCTWNGMFKIGMCLCFFFRNVVKPVVKDSSRCIQFRVESNDVPSATKKSVNTSLWILQVNNLNKVPIQYYCSIIKTYTIFVFIYENIHVFRSLFLKTALHFLISCKK